MGCQQYLGKILSFVLILYMFVIYNVVKGKERMIMIDRELTYEQRINNCYDDNREYFEEVIEKYKEIYSDFLAEETPFYDDKLRDFHAGKPFDRYVDKRLADCDEIDNEDMAQCIKLVDKLRSLDYIDVTSYTKDLDNRLKIKPFNLGVDFTDTEKIRKFVCRGEKLLEGLILPNGDFYPARGSHFTLSNYLMLAGIDVSSAIRTTCMFGQCVIFSDMKCYCENVADMNITEQQAKAMYNLYKLNSGKFDSFYEVMKASVQAGFLDHRKPALYVSNLELLETTSKALNDPKQEKPMDCFDAGAFEQELRDEAVLNRFNKYIR